MTVDSINRRLFQMTLDRIKLSTESLIPAHEEVGKFGALLAASPNEQNLFGATYLDALFQVILHPNVTQGTASRVHDTLREIPFGEHDSRLLRVFNARLANDMGQYIQSAKDSGFAHCRHTAAAAFSLVCGLVTPMRTSFTSHHLTALLIARDMWEQGAFANYCYKDKFSRALRLLASEQPEIFTTHHVRTLQHKGSTSIGGYNLAIENLAENPHPTPTTLLAKSILRRANGEQRQQPKPTRPPLLTAALGADVIVVRFGRTS